MQNKFLKTKYGGRILLLVILLPIMSCGGPAYHPTMTPEQMLSEPVTSQVLAPGDVVDIKFLYAPELNDLQRIRPDGTIDLQLVGEVKAANKSVEALQQELNQRYATDLKKPSVTVTAKELRNSKVYVGGEVNKPGAVDMPGQMTAFEAINNAGGFNMTTANVQNVVIVRNQGGKHSGTVVNFRDALTGKEIKPYYLQPGDVVFVPQTTIAKVNQWVEQHINRMLPRVPISFVP